MWGCVEGAKGSADRTHWPSNVSAGVLLVTGARVRRLEINSSGLVTGATYVDRDGRRAFSSSRCHDSGRQWHRHAAAAARFGKQVNFLSVWRIRRISSAGG